MRYINAEWLCDELGDINMDIYTDEVKEYINSAPSIDIVFCRECKHWCKGDEVYGICHRCPNTRQMRYDDFCSRGE